MTPASHLHTFFPHRAYLSRRLLLSFSLPTLFASATMSTAPNTSSSNPYPTTSLTPPSSSSLPPKEPLPRMDETPDTAFYSQPRFVTHIDDAAISRLREYYHSTLPKQGRILDLCASWISHFPTEMEETATKTARALAKNGENAAEEAEAEGLNVIGLGMNVAELDANPIFSKTVVQDLNSSPALPPSLFPSSSSSSSSSSPSSSHNEQEQLDATTCVVSIDYLTRPTTILSSILSVTKTGGSIHLVISNRCFPTKVAGEWLRVSEEERLKIVGNYLWWAGWRRVEVVDLCRPSAKEEGPEGGQGGGGGVLAKLRLAMMMGGGGDPLWVVRGVKVAEKNGEGGGHGEL
ncbi:MAG: hypothetical protein Q9186_007008 [Xanthomendoza sp. 1 TL-2023]